MRRIIQSIILFVVISFSSLPLAQENSSEKPQAELTKEEGKPFTVRLLNGNEVEWKELKVFVPLESSITLSDNSCTTASGLKFPYVVPSVIQIVVAYWKEHPRFKGQPVLEYDSDEKKMTPKTKSAFITRGKRTDFQNILKQVESTVASSYSAVFRQTLRDQWSEGWIVCGPNCKTILPPDQPTALIWDENFEANNGQLSMSRSGEVSINQVTSRYLDVSFSYDNSRLAFRRSNMSYGFSAFYPMGVSYQLQWTFRAPNLVDQDDSVCQMKWDMDFTSIFTRFQEFGDQTDDVEKLKALPLRAYLYRDEDTRDISIKEIFDPSEYDSEEFKK